MKYRYYLVLMLVINLVIAQTMLFLGVPIWLVFLAIPGLAYLHLYAGNKINFRDTLELAEIPHAQNQKRLNELKISQSVLSDFGFRKFDEFYLKTTIDILTFCYTNESQSILVYDSNLEKIQTSSLISKFANGFTLTTSNSEHAGKFPRRKEYVLQVFPKKDFAELVHHHNQALAFLSANGFEQLEIPLETHRESYLRSFKEFGKMMQGPLAPLKTFYWVKISKKKIHEKPVHQQVFAKTLSLEPPAQLN